MAFTGKDYTNLQSALARIHAVRDAKITIERTLANVKSNVSVLIGLLETIGSADTLISQGVIDEITSIGTLFNSGANSINTNHAIFLNGATEE